MVGYGPLCYHVTMSDQPTPADDLSDLRQGEPIAVYEVNGRTVRKYANGWVVYDDPPIQTFIFPAIPAQ